MKYTLRRIRKVPFFPFVPFVPLLLAGGMIALEAFTLVRMRRLRQTVDALIDSQQPEAV
jgi:hypothetical protein